MARVNDGRNLKDIEILEDLFSQIVKLKGKKKLETLI